MSGPTYIITNELYWKYTVDQITITPTVLPSHYYNDENVSFFMLTLKKSAAKRAELIVSKETIYSSSYKYCEKK